MLTSVFTPGLRRLVRLRPLAAVARLAFAAALAFTGLATTAPFAAATAASNVIACSQAALVGAITAANAGSGGVIVFPANCTITLDGTANGGTVYDGPGPTGLPAITSNVTIDGAGGTIQRDTTKGSFRLFAVGDGAGNGNLTLINLTLANGLAQGGAGGAAGQRKGGGGGGGMGGAAAASTGFGGGGGGGSVLSSAAPSGNIGGAGGGPVGGAAGTADGAAGGAGGRDSGGGGSAVNLSGPAGIGGAGGFGGGGGAAGLSNGSNPAAVGGAGGFGGGGGGGGADFPGGGTGGAGGFGGGSGGTGNSGYRSGGGGGGGGFGGAVFVLNGASLTLSGASFSGNTAQGGAGGGGGATTAGHGGDGDGGAIFNAGTLCDANASLSGNQALGGGSGATAGAGNGPDIYTLGSAVAQYPGGPTIGPGSAPTCATTAVNAAAASAIASASAQTISLQATVAAGGAVTGGTVTFVVLDSTGAQVGSAASGAVSVGAASASYTLPADTAAGSYTIDAIYTPSSGQAIAGAVGTNTLTVSAAVAPAITSANSAAFTVGTAGSFTVTASGVPAPAFSESGNLPSGVSLNATSGVLSGTPAAGSASTYPLTIIASNGVSPNASQSFTLTVDSAPAFTSGAGAVFTVGGPGSFTVTATGYPAPTYSETGSLPSGVTLNSTTGALAGTPASGTNGAYPITLKASNGVAPDATQPFTLTVGIAAVAPTITSAASAAFTVGTVGSFTVTATGNPPSSFSETGSLPSGVTFSVAGVLAGTPASGTNGSYPITLTASNGVSPNATQSFALTVSAVPTTLAITTASLPTATVGSAYATTLVASGGTAPLTWSLTAGSLPAGLSLNASTGAIGGTPTAADTRLLTLTVRDGGSPQQTASATFALYVTTGAGVSGSTLGTATGAPLTIGSASSLRAGTVGGSGALAVATYQGDPVVPAAFTVAGSYFDVVASANNTFTSVTVTRCSLSGSQVSLVWWNGDAWQAVSPTPTYDATTGCLTFILSNASSPTLSQLAGTPFAVSGAEETEVTTTPFVPPPGWITVQVLNSRTRQPVLGSVVKIADAPPIPSQTVTSTFPVLVFPALWLTSGYNGTNQYGVVARVPAGWTLNGPAEQMALVQSAAGTPVVFTADSPPSWARVTGATAQLWSGVDSAAVSFGRIAQGAVLRVDRDTPGQPRVLVYNPASKNWAWVDRTAITLTIAP